MSDQEREQDRPGPRVVDKRVSSGGHAPSAPATPPPSPEPPPSPASDPPSPDPAPPAGEQVPLDGDPSLWTPEQEQEAMRIAQEIAERPSLDWVINAAVNLANVAATKIQVGDPADAQLAIDALSGILKATEGRLGDADEPLRQTLAQLQLAFAQRVMPPPGPESPSA